MNIVELGRGRYSDCFKVADAQGHAVALKLSYYQEATIRAFTKHTQHGNRGAAHEAKDQDAISVSMAMAEVAKLMHAHQVSPHFVKVYCEADIRCLPLRLKPLLLERLTRITPRQIKYSHVCLMELFTCDLTSFIRRYSPTDATIQALLFHVLYTVACLQLVFPGFRHNDLSTNNVLVKPAKYRCVQYTVGDTTFTVCSPYMAALADFDFTHVTGHDVLTNERVLSGKYGITDGANDAYDVHLLLKTLRRSLRRHGLCPATVDFINKLRLDGTDRVGRVLPHLTPLRLLYNDYFAPLQGVKPCDKQYTMPVA